MATSASWRTSSRASGSGRARARVLAEAFLPAGLVAAFALIACPQISSAAGLLAVLRA